MKKKLENSINKDRIINKLYFRTMNLLVQVESNIDIIKKLLPHSIDGNHALDNLRGYLKQLSSR